jgi:hypothetical protein
MPSEQLSSPHLKKYDIEIPLLLQPDPQKSPKKRDMAHAAYRIGPQPWEKPNCPTRINYARHGSCMLYLPQLISAFLLGLSRAQITSSLCTFGYPLVNEV